MTQEAERFEDMSQHGRLRVIQQDDGDMIVYVIEDLNSTNGGPCAGVEFCTSGGKSPKTREALRALMLAMAEDNSDRTNCHRRGERGLGVDSPAIAAQAPIAPSPRCETCAYGAPLPLPVQAEPPPKLGRHLIRSIFMQHGFTIKEGQSDLKSYVYDAAEALLAEFAAQPQQPAPTALTEKPTFFVGELPADFFSDEPAPLPLPVQAEPPDLEGLAHKIYSAAQLAPGEGVIDGVDRIVDLLGPAAQEPLTNDQIWTSPVIMVANAEAGLLFDKLAMVVRAAEAAHGITGAAK